MFKKLSTFVIGLLVGLSLISAGALAVDYGWNPGLGTEAFHGTFISQGPAVALVAGTVAAGTGPNIVVSGSGGCGTLANAKGGATAGQVTTGIFSVSCTLTLTMPTAAPNGYRCLFNDLTTPANSVPQATTSTTTCVTTAATVVTGDVVQFQVIGY